MPQAGASRYITGATATVTWALGRQEEASGMITAFQCTWGTSQAHEERIERSGWTMLERRACALHPSMMSTWIWASFSGAPVTGTSASSGDKAASTAECRWGVHTVMQPAAHHNAKKPKKGHHQDCFAGCFPLRAWDRWSIPAPIHHITPRVTKHQGHEVLTREQPPQGAFACFVLIVHLAESWIGVTTDLSGRCSAIL